MDGDSQPQFHFAALLLSGFSVNALTADVVFYNLVVLVLLFCSAMMSASEVAFFSLTAPELDNMRESDDKLDRKIFSLLEQPRSLLSTILITNNLVNIGIVVLSYYITKRMLNFSDLVLNSFFVPGYVLEFIFNVVLVTFVIVLFGEATPKVYATQYKFAIARLMAPIFSVLVKIYTPVNWLLVGSTRVLEKRLKKRNTEIDIEEINKAIEITVEQENTTGAKEDAKMLKGVVQLGNITVKQVMRPRMEIAAIDESLSFKELLEEVKEKGYSRMPVFKDSIDNITGVLYIKDLLEHLDKDENFAWQQLVREPLFVPENKRIDDLLREIQRSRRHLAIVVDEFGGTKGIVTLEDIVEEVVGDIKDEFDEVENDKCVRKIADGLFVASGRCLIDEVAAAMELPEDFFDEVKGESETISGLI
ncbi:MAG: gliding motility-associated protein GldE, partial [Chitinophagales bacterium]|nr:gliding motility-associated protein GldE [Chitinophagales bacterium]